MSIYVSIYLWGDNLDSDRVTAIVGLPPLKSLQKGEETKKDADRIWTAKTGMWVFNTKNYVASSEASEHIKFVFDNIGQKIRILRDAGEITKVRVLIISPSQELFETSCESRTEDIDEKSLDCLAKMGASLSFVTLLGERNLVEP